MTVWRKYRFALSMFLLGSVVVCGLALSKSGPRYQGRHLDEWLVECQSTNEVVASNAERAVRAIGTNALPVLLSHLDHQDSAVENWLRNIELLASMGQHHSRPTTTIWR